MGVVTKKAGFTLIEPLIVVAITGILAAIANPAFIGDVKRAKASEATRDEARGGGDGAV